jgi:lipopolysaccharide transport system ATP-binding protein
MSDAIIVENLSKRFRRHHAGRPHSLKEAVFNGFRNIRSNETFWGLRDVSFRVKRGCMVGVIGQNGAGKSTLLRLIGGVGRPDGGRIQVDGRIGALLDLTAGFHPDLTGRENVSVSGVICGLTRREVAERMDSIIEFAELENSIDTPIRTYSTGMQMRLGFAVAIHTQPEVLLIDEVLAVGDIAFQQKCFERINVFRDFGCSILLISHDLEQIEKFCDEAIWLRSGELVAQGKPEIIVGEYTAQLASETRRRTPLQTPSSIASSGANLFVNKNRFGSMELEIQSVHLTDRQARSVMAIATGHPLSVEIEYRAKQPVAQPIFTVSISDEEGSIWFDTSTAAHGLEMPLVQGCGRIALHLERVDLARGKYFVDVGIFERTWAYGYDYHWHVYPLEVRGVASKGILHPPQLWELTGQSDSKRDYISSGKSYG